LSRAAANGAALEADVVRLLAGYAPAIYWHKNEPTFKKVGKDRWVPSADGPPDFIATWPRLGLTVLFDAKSTEGDRWSVCRNGRPGEYIGLQPHQRTALRAMNSAGGIAGVYLRLRSSTDPLDLWLPFSVVDPLWQTWWDTRREQFVGAEMGVPVVGGDLLGAIR
jgi:hypothetical protein